MLEYEALVLAYIALSRFRDLLIALEVIRSEEPDINRMSIHFAFNYAMALWGERSGQIVREPFDRVREIEGSSPPEMNRPPIISSAWRSLTG